MKYTLEGEETARLKYRLVQHSDYDAWLPLFEEDIAHFVGLGHLNTPQQKCDIWFERAFMRYENDLGGLNALTDKNTGELIGQSGLLVQEVDGVTHLEVGYSLLPKFWQKGYAIEAASKCRDCAFERGYTDELISIIHVENEPSKKVARANGMQHWKDTLYKGMPVSVFRISRAEWQNLKS
jgi:ribosomal-protein-alanine N-acetyltransferase